MTIEHSLESIGPVEAKELLDKNVANRSLREKRVDQLADVMLAGNWRYNGEPIRISESGTLLDGQHRLAAVEKSGKTFEFMVIRGLPQDVMPTIDCGAKRTAADALRIIGAPEYNTTAAAIGAYLMGFYGLRIAATPVDVQNFYTENRETVDLAVEIAGSAGRFLGSGKLFVSVAIFMLKNDCDVNELRQFFRRLEDGELLSRGNPILTLRNKFITDRSIAHHMPHARDVRDRWAMVIRAWNAWRRGERVTRIVLSRTPAVWNPKLVR